MLTTLGGALASALLGFFGNLLMDIFKNWQNANTLKKVGRLETENSNLRNALDRSRRAKSIFDNLDRDAARSE